MTRQLLAFLALLSGLAALNGPAHAAATETMACNASVAVSADSDIASEQDRTSSTLAIATARDSSSAAMPRAIVSDVLNIRPVLIGIDRAYE